MLSTEQKWPGLITNASPYALPVGACQIQVNVTTAIPGQMTCRGGMQAVSFVGGRPSILDAYPYEAEATQLIVMREDGTLVALSSPAYGDMLQPYEPDLSVAGGHVKTSYTMRYQDGTYGAVTDDPPAPPVETVTNVLDGNQINVYYVDAENNCTDGRYDAFDGGNASTDDMPRNIQTSGLCEL